MAHKKLSAASLRLDFLGEAEPQLHAVRFQGDSELGLIASMRGRSSEARIDAHTFTWSPAVRALSVLLLRTVAKNGEGKLSGEEGSLAASLDYAVSKNPAWLSDMFGVDQDGIPYARHLILRQNPERKRPGPVIVTINSQLLPGHHIEVYLDERHLRDASEVSELALAIECRRKGATKIACRSEQEKIFNRTSIGEAETMEEPPEEGSGLKTRYVHLTSALEVEQSYAAGLKRRVLQRSFAFNSKLGVAAWCNLCSSPEFTFYHNSHELMKEVASELVAPLPSRVNCIIVWPGNGEKEQLLLNALGNKVLDYSLVDLSEPMIEVALRKLPNPSEVFIADFMQPGALKFVAKRVHQRGPNFFIFLGHTLGAWPQGELLHLVRNAMSAEDYCIFEVDTSPPEQVYDERAMLEDLLNRYDKLSYRQQIMSSLNPAGINSSHGVIEVESHNDRFYPELRIAEMFFRFKTSLVTTFRGEDIPFVEGERILVASMYLYTREVIERALYNHGFSIIERFAGRGGALEILCQRRSFV